MLIHPIKYQLSQTFNESYQFMQLKFSDGGVNPHISSLYPARASLRCHSRVLVRYAGKSSYHFNLCKVSLRGPQALADDVKIPRSVSEGKAPKAGASSPRVFTTSKRPSGVRPATVGF